VSEGAYGRHGLNLATHVGDDPDRVGQNRRIARERFELPDVVYMDQVHGSDVAIINSSQTLEAPTADALVTNTRGITLAVLVADCVPVMLHDSEAGVIAAVHVGRRGIANGVVKNAVDVMRSLGALSIRAVMGPARLV
jgi:YfiH family protein